MGLSLEFACRRSTARIVFLEMRQLGVRQFRLLLIGLCLLGGNAVLRAAPPFSGTIFTDPDIIREDDPTTYIAALAKGNGVRLVFDRRENRWLNLNVYLFLLQFEEGLTIEGRVNQEFGQFEAAERIAFYAEVLGRIPAVLKKDIESVTLHDGVQPFGGGNRNVLIHHGQGELYLNEGILEEVLVHEAVHTSLDAEHGNAQEWLTAQQSDGGFISNHAENHPLQEDVAESFLLYLALNYREDRISDSLRDTTLEVMPARLSYFVNQGFDLYPIEERRWARELWIDVLRSKELSRLNWEMEENETAYAIDVSDDLKQWRNLLGRLTKESAAEGVEVSLGSFYRVRKLD